MKGNRNSAASLYGRAARSRPTKSDLSLLVCSSNPLVFHFSDDGAVPNHPSWPLLVFSEAFRFPQNLAPIAVVNDVFSSNGWGSSWYGPVYNFLHYHSRVHEALGVVSGHATVRFGGDKGSTIKLGAGDVVAIPAGVGHQCVLMSDDFGCVFSYPPKGVYDECRPETLSKVHRQQIGQVGRPATDPLFGSGGPLLDYWTR